MPRCIYWAKEKDSEDAVQDNNNSDENWRALLIRDTSRPEQATTADRARIHK